MNICERLVVMAESPRIDVDDLPAAVTAGLSKPMDYGLDMLEADGNLTRAMAAVEKRIISKALATHGTQTKAALALGVNQSTIARKIKKHGLG